jgi:hypothetical protein
LEFGFQLFFGNFSLFDDIGSFYSLKATGKNQKKAKIQKN